MQVGAAEFHPRPKVDSVLVEIRFDPDRSRPDFFETLRYTVRAAFSSRRKTLANNLAASLPAELFGGVEKSGKRPLVQKVLEAVNLRQDIRAEDVTVEEFNKLAASISKLN
jgi:16S rRNA (adenine1518-N6/adenine1519-N6)-dimethyltransferase